MVLLDDTGTPVPVEKFTVNCFNSFPAVALSCLGQWLEHSVYNREVASSGPIIGILTVNLSTGTRNSCVQ